jgi:nicotinate-nucleotide adenylyltransferase
MISRPRVGLLGGTFDPIHCGHLAVARLATQALDLAQLRVIPSGTPPHRPDSPRASGYHRVEMIRRALAEVMTNVPVYVEVSDLELHRHGPSYTWDTLHAFHLTGLTPLQMVFITGADAFAEIGTWHRYPDVLEAAHFAVLARPGTTLASLRLQLPALADRMILPDQLDRASLPRIVLVDGDTPAISATDIRRRAGRGESLDGLVPPSVAAYIEEHGLYRATTPPCTADHRNASASARQDQQTSNAETSANRPDGREGRPDAPPPPGYGKVSAS